jgi:hypothetical protein
VQVATMASMGSGGAALWFLYTVVWASPEAAMIDDVRFSKGVDAIYTTVVVAVAQGEGQPGE